jgi:HK97 family phage prohead protease
MSGAAVLAADIMEPLHAAGQRLLDQHSAGTRARPRRPGVDQGDLTMSDIDTRQTGNDAWSAPRENLFRALVQDDIFELRATGDGEMPVLKTRFAVFNQWTEIDSYFEGRFLERIAPGAFKKTIRDSRDQIKVLFQHGRDFQVGDKPLGPIETLREEPDGPYAEVPLLDTSYNRDLIPGLEAGLYGASFRFQVMREDIVQNPKRSDYNPDGLPERTIKELRLAEFGPVTFPAYAGATAGLRSITDRFIAPSPDDAGRNGHLNGERREHNTDGAGKDHPAVIRLGIWLRDNPLPYMEES